MSKGMGPETAMELMLEPVLELPALQGAAFPLCPPSEWRQLLPLAQALTARRALPSGERQGDLVPKRERDWREVSRPGPSSEQVARLGQARAGPPRVAARAAVAALGLGCGTHQPVARACRSGPRTDA